VFFGLAKFLVAFTCREGGDATYTSIHLASALSITFCTLVVGPWKLE